MDIRVTIIAICMLSLAGCMTEGRVTGWMDDHPAVSARYCANTYPVKTEYRVGKDSVQYMPVQVGIPGGMVGIFLPINPASDSLLRRADTARSGNLTLTWQRTDSGYHIDCRADSLQVVLDSLREIHLRVDTQLQENTAHVRALQADSAYFVRQANEATTRGDKWQKWAYYALAGVVLLAGWTFRNPILGLVKKMLA